MTVELRVVDNDDDKIVAQEIVENHHSYVPSFKSVGRRVDWLIYVDNELCGMIGVGSSTYPPCKDLLNRLGISKDEYKDMFNNIANNWRFCMTKRIRNVGSQVLKLLRTEAPIEWKRRYGDDLKYLITFVAGGNNGAVYLADNWENIGFTSGLPPHKSVSMKWDSKEELHKKFVKPNGENRKIILFKQLKPVVCVASDYYKKYSFVDEIS